MLRTGGKIRKSASWLHSPEEDYAAKAHESCQLYTKALEGFAHGRLGICCDENTGMHSLERQASTKPAPPGRRARRARASLRHGTRGLINALGVATGQRAWTIGTTRKATADVAHLTQASHRLPQMQRDAWVMDHWHTHGSLEGCRLVARWCKLPFEPASLKKGPQRRAFLRDPSHRHVLPCTPKHGAWLNQAAVFFGVLHRRFLARGRFRSPKDCARR